MPGEINEGATELVFLKKKAANLASSTRNLKFCYSLSLMLCLYFSVGFLLGPCLNYHTHKCEQPTSLSHLIDCSLKCFWHISLQGSVDKTRECVYKYSVVVTLKFAELLCFDKTVTSQNLLLPKNISRILFSLFRCF